MLNDYYAQGAAHALGEIEKLAGAEFAEKLAEKMGFGKRVAAGAKDLKDKVFGKVKSGYEGAKNAVKNPKETAKAFGASVKADAKTTFHRNKGEWTPGGHVSGKDRAKAGGRLAAKTLLPAGALGGAGYAGYKAVED